ncbi:unnamed protein product [Microthlaspi erraticum]|uniref:Uncharacterized protein n=1 Tax=Microthlaspi erraticum TaxID=1685480 RepID=A0A6D2HSI6_9BRAS|nr:unnamed protein product [Microthlaspi erraticum]
MLYKYSDHSLILTEAYRMQRRHNNTPETESEKFAREYHWLSLVKGTRGAFSLVLYDHLKKTLFAAAVSCYTSSNGLKSYNQDKVIRVVQTHDSLGSFPLTAQIDGDDTPTNTDVASTGHNYWG